jgi:hypothetical protein
VHEEAGEAGVGDCNRPGSVGEFGALGHDVRHVGAIQDRQVHIHDLEQARHPLTLVMVLRITEKSDGGAKLDI